MALRPQLRNMVRTLRNLSVLECQSDSEDVADQYGCEPCWGYHIRILKQETQWFVYLAVCALTYSHFNMFTGGIRTSYLWCLAPALLLAYPRPADFFQLVSSQSSLLATPSLSLEFHWVFEETMNLEEPNGGKSKSVITTEERAHLSANVDFPWSESCPVEQKKIIEKWYMYQCEQ